MGPFGDQSAACTITLNSRSQNRDYGFAAAKIELPGTRHTRALHLALSTSVANPSPINLISIILRGVAPREGERGRWMPAFAGAFTAKQVSDLAAYLRADFGKAPAWRDVDEEVRKVMQAMEQP